VINRLWENDWLTGLRGLSRAVVKNVTSLVTIPTLDGRTFR
jgi:hypothetical protein